MLKSLSMPVRLLLLAVIIVAAWAVLSPDSSSVKKPTKKPVATRKVRAGEVEYTPDDYKVRFASAQGSLKDAFKPLVAKAATSKGGSLIVNTVPATFAGGEANWVYTGTAEIDGVLQALLENRTTGEGVFLKVGETWKGSSVEEITEDSVVLVSPDTGLEKKLTLPADDSISPGPAGFAPAQLANPPALRGNIGPLTVQPDPNAQDNFTGTGNTVGAADGSVRGFGRRNGGSRRNRGANGLQGNVGQDLNNGNQNGN